MRLNASVFYGLQRPSECDLRLYLRANGVKEGKPSPYQEVIIELGQWYEEQYLSGIGQFADLRGGDEDERIQRTIEAVQDGASVLHRRHHLPRRGVKETGAAACDRLTARFVPAPARAGSPCKRLERNLRENARLTSKDLPC